MKQLVSVVYDGIKNSVFKGQVLEPLRLLSHEYIITLVSFELKPIDSDYLKALQANYPNITFIIRKRLRVFTQLSLYPAIYQLKKIIGNFESYTLRARGPLASIICAKAANPKQCQGLIIQVRGLLGAEYEYVNQIPAHTSWFSMLRAQDLYALEQKIYNTKLLNNLGYPVRIEAVSQALKDYLVETYTLAPESIYVPTDDIPEFIAKAQIKLWRKEIRKELGINPLVKVFCYNGSAKPWQCPDQVIAFFKEQLIVKPKSFLLIITQETAIFKLLLQEAHIARENYALISVDHAQIYRYLSACDKGIIFRKPHIINWISRPTKVLEYQAVGLEVIHNNTVKWLTHNCL